MKYYKVKCKFGHVRRDKYLPMYIPVIAINKKQASEAAKKCGGIKRDHKDWCLESPIEISYDDYLIAQIEFNSDLYWKNITRKNLHLFEDRLVDEPNYHRNNGIKTNKIEYIKKQEKSIKTYKKRKIAIILSQSKEKDWDLTSDYTIELIHTR